MTMEYEAAFSIGRIWEENSMDIVAKQLALDYCLESEDVLDADHHFTEHMRKTGRRRFLEEQECFLKIAAVNGKLLFTGRADIIELCREKYREASGEWFMEPKVLAELGKLLSGYGYQIEQVHLFYVASEKSEVEDRGFETVWYDRGEILQFKGDARFDEAFIFSADTPDEIGVAACQGDGILGMAGATSDSPYLWQIGINVASKAKNRGIGTALVALMKNALLDRGVVPYYGTALSHIASQRVAIRAGFLPTWAELRTSPIPKKEGGNE